jgi:riboflavin synthase
MFTGIVRERGTVVAVREGSRAIRLVVRAPETAAASGVGDSISIGGACLTAVAVEDGSISFDAVSETLNRTTLAALREGAAVNVEPSLRVGDPLGGHFVQGHVDGVGVVSAVEPEGDGTRVRVEAPAEILRYCVEKGSITVEGVSLTIAALDEGAFAAALVPHTLAATTLGELEAGDRVNLEVDVLAKYVERLLSRT